MLKKIGNLFKGDRKYFAIVFFIFILILLVGVLTPVLEEKKLSSWQKELKLEIQKIENESIRIFKEKEIKLLSAKNEIKSDLIRTLGHSDYTYRELIAVVNDPSLNKISIELVAPNGKLIAWNDIIAVTQNEIFPLNYPVNETYFHTQGIVTYLTVSDTLNFQNDVFYLVISVPIENRYILQNEYFEQISFIQELSNKFNTQFRVSYDPYALHSKDGREYSFNLLNVSGTKIGLITFSKPLINMAIAYIQETTVKIQSLLIVIGLIFLGLGFRKDLGLIKYRSLKLLSVLFYLSLCRLIFFWINFPSTILDGPLTDPAYFSSIFAGGLVKSPAEFLITNIFLVILAIFIVRYALDYVSRGVTKKFILIKIILAAVFIILFVYAIRGLSASIKSVIYDSSIRYFKEPELIPDLPVLVMNLNVLLIGFAIIALMTSLVILSFAFTSLLFKSKMKSIVLLYILFMIAGYVFYSFHREPLISLFLIIIFISLIFLLLNQVYFRQTKLPFFITYILIVSSIITISLQNYFNLQLERSSLKTIAYEINRANEDLLQILVDETLRNSVKDESLTELFLKRNINFDAEAFILWSKSSLQRESLNSQVALIDRNKNILGKFTVALNEEINYFDYFTELDKTIPSVKEVESMEQLHTTKFVGIVPVTRQDIISGYLGVAAEFNIEKIGSDEYPDFLQSNRAVLGSVIDLSLVNIFEFTDGKISQVYGNIFPSRDQTEQILSATLSQSYEGWINISINNENFLTFVFKQMVGGRQRVTTVAIKEKELSWNLFNFFKIFLVHSLFIIILILSLAAFRSIKVQYTFRTKLLIAFLLISIIPIVILAVYNRQVAKDRSESEIFNELNKRCTYLENHINAQLQKHKEREFITAFENAAKELGISFIVYKISDQLYSSRKEFFETGLFNTKLNPVAHYNLNYLSYREYLTKEKVNNLTYDAFYKKYNPGSESLIIGVNDAFNKIKLTYSTVDFDVLLFGTYSFAVLIIILVSTLFADQISAPIRRLTKATESVAQGDLSVQLRNSEKGELKDLYDGFNLMTKELQKNQVEIAELERESAWKEMAKQVAHEIKNPLTPMKLAIQQIMAAYNDKKDGFEELLKKLSQSVLNQIESLSQIATEFSAFAKMPSIKMEVFEIVAVVNDAINLFADEKIDINFTYDSASVFVDADQSQFRRMIINMIRNSIQAEAKQIQIESTVQNSNVSLRIIDDGNGIFLENRSKIFDANFTTKDKGMGLGLKLTKRFLEYIKGDIKLIESSTLRTEFLITIPLHIPKNSNQPS